MKHILCATIAILCFNPLFSKIQNKDIPTLISVPAGSFYMGADDNTLENRDETPAHRVTISKPFRMSETEITNAQYERFDPSHKQFRGKYGLSREDDEAVIFVSYNEAKAYCEWLSKEEGIIYRLPTEAEWEYACRAGTYSRYYTGDDLPGAIQKKQYHLWGTDVVSLKVKNGPANAFGLYDMHGNVEEWCVDWYGAYLSEKQTDPVGPSGGLFRVTRGGSYGTPVKYLRSANRMAMLPDDKHWMTGFRVVQADYPTTKMTTLIPEKPLSMDRVSQRAYTWKIEETQPFFKEPIVYVNRPDCEKNVPFYHHNHCPAVTWCENGDLLAVWFSTDDEAGREMTILASRLRVGKTEWDAPSEFFKVPDRNMTGSSLFHDGKGRLIYINGMEVAGSWQSLSMVMRTSEDNGATWSVPRILSDSHAKRNQVIAGMFQTRNGWLVQACDATPGGEGGSALHISKDGGITWSDAGEGVENHFVKNGTGGSIAGIHTGVVELRNGHFLAFGRGNNIEDEQGIWKMPQSLSVDSGKSWTYSASEFPPIDGGQRLVLMRLREGPLLMISFTNHPYRIKNGLKGMTFEDESGKKFTGYGMFAALSFDEGKSWPVKRLLTDGKYRFMNGGAWTGAFETDSAHAEPRGYLTATQTPDNTIHLLSSRNHYRFNLAWLLGPFGYKLSHKTFDQVEIQDKFWLSRFETCSQKTVPDVLKKCETFGRVRNFVIAAGLESGKFTGGASWDDSDLFKALEGASRQYAISKDENLRMYMDSIISCIGAAQEEDGYLVSMMRINKEKNLPWNIRAPRFSYMIWSHELYNSGHLYEGAVAHYEATGQTNFLNIAVRNADLLVRTFLTGDSLNTTVDGHPELKIGLLKLWKVTQKPEYLLLANRMMSLRGDSTAHELMLGYDGGRNPQFFQDYCPVREFKSAYGHGVRALYLYASMADLGVYTRDSTYFDTLERLWNSITKYKMYITGGIGSRHKGEAFGENYELPNQGAYSETCSSIADILWNYRMFLNSGEGKYMDVCERILYNAFLAGWALSGTEYNYVNPLEFDGAYKYNHGTNERQPWFETSCCPTNISRFVPQIGELIYSNDLSSLYVNLFIGSRVKIQFPQNQVQVSMSGNYPWEGQVNLDIDPERPDTFKLKIRKPSWLSSTPLPESDLYTYTDVSAKKVGIKVNGKPLKNIPEENGYIVIDRQWKKGDKVTLDLPMQPRMVKANPAMEEDKGKVAIERGPIVYCAEAADNGTVLDRSIDAGASGKVRFDKNKLGGIHTLTLGDLQLIPYYSWGNRGANEMKVWFPVKIENK